LFTRQVAVARRVLTEDRRFTLRSALAFLLTFLADFVFLVDMFVSSVGQASVATGIKNHHSRNGAPAGHTSLYTGLALMSSTSTVPIDLAAGGVGPAIRGEGSGDSSDGGERRIACRNLWARGERKMKACATGSRGRGGGGENYP
jgi:hypothetical protein